jgi:hypothetical protein
MSRKALRYSQKTAVWPTASIDFASSVPLLKAKKLDEEENGRFFSIMEMVIWCASVVAKTNMNF